LRTVDAMYTRSIDTNRSTRTFSTRVVVRLIRTYIGYVAKQQSGPSCMTKTLFLGVPYTRRASGKRADEPSTKSVLKLFGTIDNTSRSDVFSCYARVGGPPRLLLAS